MAIGSPYAYLIPLANKHVAEHAEKPGADINVAVLDFDKSLPTDLPYTDREYLREHYRTVWHRQAGA